MAQAAQLQQWQHHYFSLVVRRGITQHFMFAGQAHFSVVVFYAIATVIHLYYCNVNMMYEMIRGKTVSTLLPTHRIFNLPHDIGIL